MQLAKFDIYHIYNYSDSVQENPSVMVIATNGESPRQLAGWPNTDNYIDTSFHVSQ